MQLLGGVVGAVIGFVVSGYNPYGAALGWSIGYGLTSLIMAPEGQRPDPGDLSAPKLQLGSEIPRLYGTARVPLNPVWVSPYTAVIGGGTGGKGESDSPAQQTINYRLDILGLMVDGDNVVNWVRAWKDKKLAASQDARSDADTLAATALTPVWDAMRLHRGLPGQIPPATYEDAVGVDEAVAYRGVCTIELVGADCGSYKSPSLWEFELTTNAIAGPGDVFWLINPVTAQPIVDTSSWASSVSSSNVAAGTPGLYGAAAAYNQSNGGGTSMFSSPAISGVPWTPDESLTLEARVSIAADPNVNIIFFEVAGSGGDIGTSGSISAGISDGVSPDNKFLYLQVFGTTVYSIEFIPPSYPFGLGISTHLELGYDGATKTAVLYVDGQPAISATPSGAIPAITELTAWGAFTVFGGPQVMAGAFVFDGVRFTRRRLRHRAAFTPPTVPPIDDGGGTVDPQLVDLADVVSAEMLRHPLITADMFDVSDLQGIALRGVLCSGDLATVLNDLATQFHFNIVPGSPMVFKRRGSSPVLRIPFERTGCGVDEAGEPFVGMSAASDDDVPMVPALGYQDYGRDYAAGYEPADRYVGEAPHHRKIDTRVVFTATEAATKIRQIAAYMRLSAYTARMALDESHLALMPGDVIEGVDRENNVYRVLIGRQSYAPGVHTLDLSLDDPTVSTLVGLADESTSTPSVNIPLRAPTTLVPLDIPMLRDADNNAAHYLAVEAQGSGTWPGANVQRSVDGGSTYPELASLHSNQSIIGICTTVLPSGAAWVYDNTSTVAVDVGAGQSLASSTRAAMQANDSINVAAIGAHGRWEILRFTTAALVSGTTYRLSGLVRGYLGTEHLRGTHAAADRFVLLDASLRRSPADLPGLGAMRHLRAVTLGAAAAQAAGMAFTNNAVALEMYAPTSLRVDRTATDWLLSVHPRSRFDVVFGPAGLYVPPDPQDAGYDWVLYSSNSYATVLREVATLTPAFTYTAAMQAADGALAIVYAEVFRKSTIVGRGTALRAAA